MTTVVDPWLGAACREPGVSAELFFPSRGFSHEPAKAVCERCPIKAKCLNGAMEWEARPGNLGAGRFGVFGGLTPRERQRLAVEAELRRRLES